jgi:hypothetical protein
MTHIHACVGGEGGRAEGGVKYAYSVSRHTHINKGVGGGERRRKGWGEGGGEHLSTLILLSSSEM